MANAVSACGVSGRVWSSKQLADADIFQQTLTRWGAEGNGLSRALSEHLLESPAGFGYVLAQTLGLFNIQDLPPCSVRQAAAKSTEFYVELIHKRAVRVHQAFQESERSRKADKQTRHLEQVCRACSRLTCMRQMARTSGTGTQGGWLGCAAHVM